jgi:hypothetical protein
MGTSKSGNRTNHTGPNVRYRGNRNNHPHSIDTKYGCVSQRLNLTVPQSYADGIRKLAYTKNWSVSEYMRMVIGAHLEKNIL